MFSCLVVFLDVIAWMRLFSMLERDKVTLNTYLGFMFERVCVKVKFGIFG